MNWMRSRWCSMRAAPVVRAIARLDSSERVMHSRKSDVPSYSLLRLLYTTSHADDMLHQTHVSSLVSHSLFLILLHELESPSYVYH
jgi:hypothetical protein